MPETPHLDIQSKKFQDTKQGKIITDKRHFSAEIECYYPNEDAYYQVIEQINKHFRGTGKVSDGSLDNQGVEFQTPILRGQKGEEYINSLSKLLLSNKFFVNTKAGLHIHLDGEGFTKKSLFSDKEIAERETGYFYSIQPPSNNARAFSNYLNDLRTLTRYADRRGGIASYPSASGRLETTSDLLGAVYKGTDLDIADRKQVDKIYLQNLKLDPKQRLDKIRQVLSSLRNTLSRDDMEGYNRYMGDYISQRLLSKLRQLFTVYYFADDFIMQLLPHSRRNNKYCLPLWKEFNVTEIDRLDNLADFEKMWYQLDDLHHIQQKKGDPKDITRRHGANFHILMCQGHFELRYHSGTINADKILYWVALNQALINLADTERDNFSDIRQTLEDIKFIQNLALRRKKMYDLLALPQDARDYWESRAKKFTDEDKELSPVCLQEGNSQDF
jgi:hypothetical protein